MDITLILSHDFINSTVDVNCVYFIKDKDRQVLDAFVLTALCVTLSVDKIKLNVKSNAHAIRKNI